MERCGKINAVNSGSESWTGIGVVTGFDAVVLILQWPHMRMMVRTKKHIVFVSTVAHVPITGVEGHYPSLGFPEKRNGTKDNEGITLDYRSFGGVRVFPRYLWIWGVFGGRKGAGHGRVARAL